MVPEVSNLTDPPDASLPAAGLGRLRAATPRPPGLTTVAQVISIIFSRTA
jgi:hypothetical protein